MCWACTTCECSAVSSARNTRLSWWNSGRAIHAHFDGTVGKDPVATSLTVVMYHYVRDLPRSRFPRIKGMLTKDFAAQVDRLRSLFEMATLESALAYLRGNYLPERPLCLLTFDDGLKDHFTDVLSILAVRRIQGQFFLITD